VFWVIALYVQAFSWKGLRMTSQQRKTMAVFLMVGLIGFIGFIVKRQMGKAEANKKIAAAKRVEELEKLKKTIPVIFAARDIVKRSIISEKDVKLVEMPEHDFPKLDYATSIDEIVGKIALTNIYLREAIINQRLAGKDKVTSLSYLIPKGMRAVSVKINTVDACGGFLKQNDIVDVLATFKVNDPTGRKSQTVSTNLLTRVKVMAVDKNYKIGGDKADDKEEEEADEKNRNKAGSLKARSKVSMVTLLLSPEDTERVVIASTTAKIKMILPAKRIEETDQKVERIVITNDDIEQKHVPTVVRQNDGTEQPETVEVNIIRGGKKFQRFMPYEKARTETTQEQETDEYDLEEPAGWDDDTDLTGVSMPQL